MNNRYTILSVIFLAIVLGTTLFFAFNRDGERESGHVEMQEQGHDDRDDHAENSAGQDDHAGESRSGDKHRDDEQDPHDEEEKGGEHDEPGDDDESGLIEMTREQQEEIGLTVSAARAGTLEHFLALVGEVRLHDDRVAHLVPRVPGIVRTVSVSLGEKVREGQILALIDSPELAELKADYLEKLRNLELTRRTFERKQYLKQENIASEADWLEAQSAFQNAETVLLSAKRRLLALDIGEDEIRDLPTAGDDTVASYTLKSPLAGTIIAKHLTKGEKIDAEEVFTVADLSVVWVDLQIPAGDLGLVKKGMRVEITSTEGKSAEGQLTMVGPVVSQESRTALGRVVLPNPDGLWKPGIFVKGLIQGESTSATVVVPAEAVQNIDGENIVFIPAGDGFKPVEVTIGQSLKGKTEILAGLKGGDQYVARGAFELKAVQVTSGAGGHAGHGH
jgi:cobalt-zinc-cadmium efflux system membrane fusion protein